MKYTFDVEQDPDDPEFFSIWIDNSKGSSAEVAGRIGSKSAAQIMCAALALLSQEQVKSVFSAP